MVKQPSKEMVAWLYNELCEFCDPTSPEDISLFEQWLAHLKSAMKESE